MKTLDKKYTDIPVYTIIINPKPHRPPKPPIKPLPKEESVIVNEVAESALRLDEARKITLTGDVAGVTFATEIILSELDDAMTELKYLGIDEETLTAKNYLANLPLLPMAYTDDEKPFIDELNTVVGILRNNPAVWLNIFDLPHEIWSDVENYEGLYKVSNYGRVKSLHYKSSKIISGGFDTGKYSMMHLVKDKKSKTILLHKMVAKAFLVNFENKKEINHKDGDKENNCVWNLEWATRKENMRHAAETGLIRHGEESGKAKITNNQAKYIRKMYIPRDKTYGIKALSRTFGVSKDAVSDIINGKSFKRV